MVIQFYTSCIFDTSLNKLIEYTAENKSEDICDVFCNQLVEHFKHIVEYKSNRKTDHNKQNGYPECLKCEKIIKTQNTKIYEYRCDKTGYLYGYKHSKCEFK